MSLSRAVPAAVLALLCSATPTSSQDVQPTPPPLNNDQLLQKYVWSTIGPTGIAGAAIAAALEQWRGSPEAWERDEVGYGMRWASEYAASAIGNTTQYTVARVMHQDPSFVPCKCEGVGPRLGHALAAPFKARKRNGQWEFSPATVLGITAQNVVPAATWYPAPNGIRDGAAHAVSGILSKMAVDVVKEFVPERYRKPKF